MSEPSTSSPSASTFVFLHELSKLEPGSKVRFLCCVLDYDITTGQLLVEHNYPSDAKPTPRAYVDVNIVLETVNRDILSVGAWLNIIGFFRENLVQKSTGSVGDENDARRLPLVHALIVWDAGAVNVREYERTVQASIDRLRAAQSSVER